MTLRITPLPFTVDALEPHISADTVRLHHGVHQAGYVKRVNSLLNDLGIHGSGLGDVLTEARKLHDPTLYNMAAQVWNHEFYWDSLLPGGGGSPEGDIAVLIDRDFGSYQNFVKRLFSAATGLFGSGWTWLVVDHARLKIVTTSNAERPRSRQTALLTIDVWEHAYYVDYRADRGEYVSRVIEHLLNWDAANERLKTVAIDMARAEVAIAEHSPA